MEELFSGGLIALIAVPVLLFILWAIFGSIAKAAETTAEAAGKKKDGPFAWIIFGLIIFALLSYSTYKNN
jgi:hypothetical protein